MINDGRSYGVAVALRMILNALEGKGVLSRSEIGEMLDSAREEIDELKQRQVLSADAADDAARAICLLY
jgi:hypothetical protein